MKNSNLIRMTTPVGEPLEIPLHDFGPARAKPALALVSGIHGNELNGIFVLARLANFLREKSGRRGEKIRERVIIIPAVNVLGLHIRTRTWPVDRTDINRMFPGYNAGETTQRLADAVFQRTRDAGVRVDIHASNLEFEELPQARLYGSTPVERRLASQLGLPAVIECPMNTISTTTLLYSWRQQGGHNFVLQAGVAGGLQMHHCNRLYRGLLRLLAALKIVPTAWVDEDLHAEDDGDEPAYFPLHRTVSLISDKAGLFVPRAELGRWVQKGAVLGTVHDGFDGRVKTRIRAPRAGLLTGLRHQALLYEGDLLARIQAESTVRDGADTYLIGQGQ